MTNNAKEKKQQKRGPDWWKYFLYAVGVIGGIYIILVMEPTRYAIGVLYAFLAGAIIEIEKDMRDHSKHVTALCQDIEWLKHRLSLVDPSWSDGFIRLPYDNRYRKRQIEQDAGFGIDPFTAPARVFENSGSPIKART